MAVSKSDLPRPESGSQTKVVFSLPASWYSDPGIYARERKRIFAREWLWVGREDQLEKKGQYITAAPAGYPVFVIRTDNGLRGFHNVCRHRASKILPEPSGKCRRLICPYHAWAYDFDGNLINVPNFGETPDFSKADFALFPIRVAAWMGLVFINLDTDSPDLDEWLGPIRERVEKHAPERAVFDREMTAEVACNWKSYVDNYQEGYHIPMVHSQLARDLDWKEYHVVNAGAASLHEAVARDGSTQPGVFGWRFPNFAFNFYFNGVSFMRMEPVTPGKTRLVYALFRPEDVSSEEFEKVVQYGWQVSQEDQQLLPVVQENLEAGVYDVGPLSPRHENGVYHFHQMIRVALETD